MRGDLSDNWSYDLYAMHAQMNFTETSGNDANVARMQNALDIIVDPETGEWLEGFDKQRETWEQQYAEARNRWEAHTRQVQTARAADADAALAALSSPGDEVWVSGAGLGAYAALLRADYTRETLADVLPLRPVGNIELDPDAAAALLDRLELNPGRIESMVEGLRQIAALPDPIGAITDLNYRPSGIQVGRMRVPLGVVGIIYESRPNVTADAAALCLKSGKATVLRGGAEANGFAITRDPDPGESVTMPVTLHNDIVAPDRTTTESRGVLA